jgi:hypothetical protein
LQKRIPNQANEEIRKRANREQLQFAYNIKFGKNPVLL